MAPTCSSRTGTSSGADASNGVIEMNAVSGSPISSASHRAT